MDYKKLAFGIMTLSFIMIVSGSVSSFIMGLKVDREETQKRVQEVNDEFEVFSTNTSMFETVRNELYTVVLSNIYYDTMYNDDVMVKNKLSNYEHLVDELTKNTYRLNLLCANVYYPSKEANNQCHNYKSIYEQVVNYFVSDIHLYNQNISKYNNYQIENGSLFRLGDYVTKKDFIDYNNDKKYDGKEE